MTLTELRPASFSDTFGPVGWSGSLVAVLLLHLAFAYYIFVYHRMEVDAPPPPPKAILIDLAPVSPLLGPQIAPPGQPLPPQQPSIVPPSPPPIVPPSTPVNPSLAAPTQPVETTPIPDLPKLPDGVLPPSAKATDAPPTEKKPEVKKPEQTKPQKQQPEKTKPRPKSQPPQLPIAPGSGAMEKANPITLWQLAVLKRLQPYMIWPPDAPYWIDTAAPTVRVTIDREGHVTKASVIRTSGYEAFDKAARKIFKRALTLPPPPPEMPGDPLTFNMAVTFTQ
jgi:protein TonB